MNILCCREFMRSIKDSVHSLLSSIVREYPIFENFYEILNNEIRGNNGTTFIFIGVRNNVSNLKSLNEIKKCWVEEAETVSQYSWDVLVPSIRAEGSEIIVSFNPDMDDSPTYQKFVIETPIDSLVKKVGYADNPFFPDVLRKEMEDCQKKDTEKYNNIWLGNCRSAVEGAIFQKQIEQAYEEGRITNDVIYDPSVPVDTFWDLGKSDMTAIWFAQYVGMQWRLLRHYSSYGQEIEHYTDYVRAQEYKYSTHYLPHDARQNRLGMVRTVEYQIMAALGSTQVIDRVQHKVNSIEAAKAIFPLCWFHSELCSDGLIALKRYRYDKDPQTGRISKNPLHDIYSDSSDAFQSLALAATPKQQALYMPKKPTYNDSGRLS